jgi:hypothetical protein
MIFIIKIQGGPFHETACKVGFLPAPAKIISLSPYDNFNPLKESHNMRLLAHRPVSSIVTPDQDYLERMRRQGLSFACNG